MSSPLLATAPGSDKPVPLVAWTATVVRILVAGIWVWAAIPKLESPAGSAAAVRAFQLFPEWLVTTIGYGLPFVGAGLAVLLASGLAIRLAAAVSAVLIATFAVGVATAAARDLDILCGFLDVGGTLPFGQTAPFVPEIVRDDALLLALGFLVWAGSSRFALDNVLRRPRTEPVVAAAARGDWLATELLAEQRYEAAWRIRVASASCLAGLAALLVLGLVIQGSRAG
ncbi:MAG TPA: MauE/DoxX family redox-associated membrane protein [Mycobacteriales bacterium]|nr:MauE/DoxX family redox-associated membrane protein [Mycobacteriales bacterium]